MARLTLNDTMNRLLLLIRAGYPVIYIVSHEERRVLHYLAKLFRVIKAESPLKHFLRHYEGMNLEVVKNLGAHQAEGEIDWLKLEGLPEPEVYQPHGQIRQISEVLNAIRGADLGNDPVLGNSLTVLFDLHPYLRQDLAGLGPGELVRPLRNAADALRRYYDKHQANPQRIYKTIVIVAPSAGGLSAELERDLIVVDFPLPEPEELRLTLENKIQQGTLAFPAGLGPQARQQLVDLIAGAGRGLTLEDYKLGLNMFAVRKEPLEARHIDAMLDLKAKAINSQALQYTPRVEIKLGGLEGIREWISKRRDAVVSQTLRERYHLPPPKGVMLCGASGGGKSQLAKLIASEFNVALLRLDVGALFGQYVGESEERTRQALLLAEILAPVVLWLDEVDKAFTGIAASGDNGVSARVFGHFLTWLSEKQDDVFVVATANDFQGLLNNFPEFGRKGRFDEIFWVELPNQEARQEIFRIYLEPHLKDNYLELTPEAVQALYQQENLPPAPSALDPADQFYRLLSEAQISANLTGAEIEAAINEALYESYFRQHEGLSPALVVHIVKACQQKALYNPGTQDAINLQNLQATAQAKGWPFAGGH